MLFRSLENVGTVLAENVVATLTSSDSFVTITDATQTYGNIAGQTKMNIADAFAFDIAGNIPDQHPIAFTLQAAGQETWSSNFNIVANAPHLKMLNFTVNDASGNNNGMLDPGETADLIITGINNGHAAAYDVTGLLTSSDQYITVNNTSAQSLGDLNAGDRKSVV